MKTALLAGVLAGAMAFASLGSSVLAAQIAPHEDKTVTTRHKMTAGGRALTYTARAGLLPIYVNDTGELMASVFFIAYSVPTPAGAPPRPVTFLWNGGPGSNSAQLQFMGVGPKRPTTAATYPDYGPNTETPLIDNPDSWLATSDLVFIDPVGTGFSRATSKEFRDVLYSSRGNSEAVAEAIRVYLTRYDGWQQPLFIGGESYGTTRAMLVAEALEKRRTRLSGVILMSGDYAVGQKVSPALAQALQITEFTAIAHYHRRLPADLQALSSAEAEKQAEAWVRAVYAPALEKRDALSADERAAVLAGIQRFTGVDSQFVDAKTLRLESGVFFDRLLSDKGFELGRYDGRVTLKSRPEGTPWLPTGDPSLQRMADLMNGTSRVYNGYIRHDLGFESDLAYRGPFGGAFHPEPLDVDARSGVAADWMTRMFKMDRSEQSEPPLARAMRINPKLKVWNVRGMYDASCAAMNEAVAQSPADLSPRVSATCLVGGHMFYSDRDTRQLFKHQFDAFVAASK
ncbi:S10 family serine carboxypeptidase-like protein [Caulobacter segnis]